MHSTSRQEIGIVLDFFFPSRNTKQSLQRSQTMRLRGATKICVTRQYETKAAIDNCGTVHT